MDRDPETAGSRGGEDGALPAVASHMIDAMASLSTLWVDAVAKQTAAVAEAMQETVAPPAQRSWYRHPDTHWPWSEVWTAYGTAGAFGAGGVGWPMPFSGAALFGVWPAGPRYPTAGFFGGYPPFNLVQSPAWFNMPDWPFAANTRDVTLEPPKVGSDVRDGFAHVRSNGGHAMAQIICEPYVKCLKAGKIPFASLG